MKKCLALLLFLSTMVLAACHPPSPQSTDGVGQTTAPTVTTQPATITQPTTTQPAPTTQPTAPTQPLPSTPAEVLAEFNALFGELGSWYNKALYCEYATPAQLVLFEFFLSAFNEESNQVSASERAQLKDLIGNPDVYDHIDNLDITRLPTDRMNQVLQDYFGITLDDIDDAGFAGQLYLESTDCYYIIGGGAAGVMEFNALAVEYLEDGTIRLTYTQDCWRGEATMYVVTLMPHGDGYRILSNVCLE